MSFLKQHGLNSLLKDGSSCSDKPVFQNITAITQLKTSISSCYGPNGLSKLIVNALKKRIITKDCSMVLSEVEIDHPAVSLLKDASLQQLNETGDGSAAVILFAGELARRAEKMLRETGIPLADIVNGYRKALSAVELIVDNELRQWSTMAKEAKKDSLTGEWISRNGLFVCNLRDILNTDNKNIILSLLRTSIDSKLLSVMTPTDIQYLSGIALEACMNVVNYRTDASGTRSLTFDVDHIRVIKLPGGHSLDSSLINGFVLNQSVENGTEKVIKHAKIAVYNCAFDIMATETKGNVLFETDEQMKSYAMNEEGKIEALIQKLHDKLGVNVIVANSSFGEIALHFIRKYGMMAVKVSSKYDLRRLCIAVGAKCFARVNQIPTLEDIGSCDIVQELNEIVVENLDENRPHERRTVPIGSPILVFQSQIGKESPSSEILIANDCKISTIVIRGSTQPMQEYMQQAFNNAINIFRLLLQRNGSGSSSSLSKVIDRDRMGGFIVAGGGAFEAELSQIVFQNIVGDSLSSESCDASRNMKSFFANLSSIEKMVIQEYAEALYVLPGAIADNSGGKSMSAVIKLQAAHSSSNQCCPCTAANSRCLCQTGRTQCCCGPKCDCTSSGSFIGIDIQTAATKGMISSVDNTGASSSNDNVIEPLVVKMSAFQLATDTMVDILSVDQMIMSKRAGGPKRLQGGSGEE